jgi:hypothetical protein
VRFRYKVSEGKRVRIGTLSAPDREAAHAFLVGRKLHVIELREDTSAEIEIHGLEQKPFPAIELSAPERIRRGIAFRKDYLERALLILLALGFAGFAYTWQGQIFTSEPAQAEKRYSIELSGKLSNPDGARLTFHFPEIPLTVNPGREQIKLEEDGTYLAQFDFQMKQKPSKVRLIMGTKESPIIFFSGDDKLTAKIDL